MASSGRNTGHFRGRKRFQLEDDADAGLPLQPKSTNIPKSHETIPTSGPLFKKRRQTSSHKKAKEPLKTSVFKNENVSLRLVDNKKDLQEPTNSFEKRQMSLRGRRLNNKISDLAILSEATQENSIQLDDFDQPPDSTSTPLLGSPNAHEESLPSAYLMDPIRPSPLVYNPYGYPVPSPPCGYPVPSGYPHPGLYMHGYDSPLRGRGVLYPQFPPIFMSPAHLEAYGWPYSSNIAHRSGDRAEDRAEDRFPEQFYSPRNPPDGSSASYKSSGGNATYRSSSK